MPMGQLYDVMFNKHLIKEHLMLRNYMPMGFIVLFNKHLFKEHP